MRRSASGPSSARLLWFVRGSSGALSLEYTNGCILVSVGRTNIEIDDALVSEAMQRYGLHSKRAAVDLALRRLVVESMTRDEALEMEGSGWEGDLDEMRRSRRLAG